jgi:glyoxylase-like metal-dependent hydrolase (beta-lactamase superfamily II)/rhodanese-related sulfurtransferase
VFFRQVLYRDLGCASYVLGDAGEAVVVDPRWDIDVYLEIAAAERLRIVHVVDTHEHADHVSGRGRLVAATGARAHRPGPPSADGAGADGTGPDGTGADGAAGTIAPGAEITVGALQLTALGTPGHRPEHLAFAVADLSRGPEPWMLLSGDSMLVGDVARPDLAYEPSEGASALHATLTRLLGELGDGVEVWPAHVGGSLCGGSGLSHKTSSTIGYERRHNTPLTLDESRFVRAVTTSLPSRPPNIERIVGLNRAARAASPSEPGELSPEPLGALVGQGVTVLDSRAPDEFDAGHLPGALNLPVASPGLGTRAGWALDPEQPLAIVARDGRAGRQTVSALQAVGFWNLAGVAIADPDGWHRAGLPVATARAWDVDRLAGSLRDDGVALVDVRELPEWLAGHVRGSHHVPLHRVREVAAVPAAPVGRPTAVACAGGARAAFAASLLRRAGRPDVIRVAGGGIEDLSSHGVSLAVGP